MKKIRALQQFSHYNAGTFDQNEERSVPADIADALIGMGLAEEAEPAADKAAKAKTKTGAK